MVKVLIGSVFSATLTFSATAARAQESEWYVGGTLHEATLAQWPAGLTSNRLATSADFAAALADAFKKPFHNQKQMLAASLFLADCIDEVAKEPTARTQKAQDLALLCWAQYKP